MCLSCSSAADDDDIVWQRRQASHCGRPAPAIDWRFASPVVQRGTARGTEATMSKYLITASYTPEGAKGVMKDGGTKRRQAAEEAVRSAGGKVEAFYFAFGEHDAYVIVDAPDPATIAATSMAINASGAVRSKTTVLLTPEEVDQATRKGVTYRA